MVYGLWLLVYGLWFMVHGSWFLASGLWFMVYGLWFMVHGSCFMVYGKPRRRGLPFIQKYFRIFIEKHLFTKGWITPPTDALLPRISTPEVIEALFGNPSSSSSVPAIPVQRFRGGLVFKAHRLEYYSTLGSRVMKRRRKKHLVKGVGTFLRPQCQYRVPSPLRQQHRTPTLPAVRIE